MTMRIIGIALTAGACPLAYFSDGSTDDLVRFYGISGIGAVLLTGAEIVDKIRGK